MRRFLLSVLLLAFLSTPTFAQSFDFTKTGNEEANAILKEYIKTYEIEGFYGDVVSYFYDIDNDNNPEIIGIVKSKLYCTLKGYNLVVLKQDSNGWGIISTDVHFENSLPFDISGNKITYHKSLFYKFKKAHATISKRPDKNTNYRAAASIKDHYKDKKLQGIEEISNIEEGHPSVEIDVNDFPRSEQGTFVISYPDGEYQKPSINIQMH